MSFKDLEGQLARWLERLQKYEFEIIYRKEQSHKNADGLSRRLCELYGCEYCAKVETKSTKEMGKAAARIVLERESLEKWRKGQEEDPSISIILRNKKAGVRPSRSEIAAQDISVQIYWTYWDAVFAKRDSL